MILMLTIDNISPFNDEIKVWSNVETVRWDSKGYTNLHP